MKRPTKRSLGRATAIAFLLVGFSHLPVAAQAPEKLAEGRLALREDRYDDAVEAFREAVAVNPAYYDAWVALAEALYAVDAHDSALRAADSALSVGGQSVDALLLKARILIADGRPVEAGLVLDDLGQADPHNARVLRVSGELHAMRGDLSAAAAVYDRALALSPGDRATLLAAAVVAEARGLTADADSLIDRALRYHPTDPQVYGFAAEYAYRAGRIDEALRNAEISLAYDPGRASTLRLMTVLLLELGRTGEARNLAAQYLSASGTADGFALFAETAARAGDHEQATAAYRRALLADSDDEVLRLMYETFLMDVEEPDSPLRVEAARFHLDEAMRLVDANYRASARHHVRRGLRLAPFDLDVRLAYADLLWDAGRYARYVWELETILLDNPQAVEGSVAFADGMETAEELLLGSPARAWGIDQFSVAKDRLSIRLLVDASRADDRPYVPSAVFGDLLAEAALSVDRVDVLGVVDDVLDPSDAAARGDGDYGVFARLSRLEGGYHLEVQLWAPFGLQPVAVLATAGFGPTGLQVVACRFADYLQEILPLRGRIIARREGMAIVNVGSVDGVAVGDQMTVTGRPVVEVSPTAPAYSPSAGLAIGIAEVVAVDEHICEVRVQSSGLTASPVVGAGVYLNRSAPAEIGSPIGAPQTSVYDRIRSLR